MQRDEFLESLSNERREKEDAQERAQEWQTSYNKMEEKMDSMKDEIESLYQRIGVLSDEKVVDLI